MALISGVYDDEPRNHNLYADARYQRFLAHLETLVVGEPGRPRAIPEPYQEPVEALELVDGPVVAPAPPPKPPRKRKPARKVDFPTVDRDLKLLARKLSGRD